ncbi:MAG: ion transporter [Saprospiraceae bacterium]
MTTNQSNNKLSLMDLVILFLSIYVLVVLLIDVFVDFSPEMSKLLEIVDDFICIIFISDFVYRFIKAKSKLEFLKWGWIDLISSIPTFGVLRYGRAIRVIRILRILRTFRSVRNLVKHVYRSRTEGAFTTVTMITMIMLIFSSITILQVEDLPQCNIKTAEDAIWWDFVTVTNVGYRDRYPITTEGRIIAVFLMITGVGLFGTFTGFVTSWIIGEKKEQS